MIGETIDHRYQIQTQLGAGGLGKVYQAYDRVLDRIVAVKQIIQGSNQWFEREFLMMTEFPDHPNIAKVYDYGYLSGGVPYYTMEYIYGLNLRAYMRKNRNLTVLYPLIGQICNALSFIHARGYIHGDIKPENLLVIESDAGDDPTVKIIDFGLMRVLQESRALLQGTPHYMAPELMRNEEPDARVDLYSLGVVLYEVTTGERPFHGSSFREILTKHLNETPLSPRLLNPAISNSFEALILKLLAKNPDDRFPSAYAVLEALNALVPFTLPQTSHSPILLNAPLIGRKEELDRLIFGLEEVRKGSDAPHCFMISGEVGIGKSRLLREFRYHAQISGASYFEVRCESGLPYGSFGSLCMPLFRMTAQDAPTLLKQHGPILKQLWPSLPLSISSEAPLEGLDPESSRIRRFNAVASFLKQIVQRQPPLLSLPLVLSFSSLDLADPETIELCFYLVHALYDCPILLCFSCESTASQSIQHHMEKLQSEQINRIELHRLTKEEMTLLVQSRLGYSDLPEHFFDWFFRETEGNPAMIEAIVQELIHSATLQFHQNKWQISERFSTDTHARYLSDLLEKQFQKLSAEEQTFLNYSALLGQQFDSDLLIHLAEHRWPKTDILRLLQRMIYVHRILQEHILEEKRQVRFVRFQFQRWIYEHIPLKERKHLHSQAGLLLEASGEPEKAVIHFNQGHPAHRQHTFDLAIQLAQHAEDHASSELAVRYYEEALKAVKHQKSKDAKAKKLEIFERIGDRLSSIGYGNRAIAYYKRILRYPCSPLHKAKLCLKIAKIFTSYEISPSALSWLRKTRVLLYGKNEPVLISEVLIEIGKILSLHRAHKTGISPFLYALQRVQNIPQDPIRLRLTGFIFFYIGNWYLKCNDLEKAEEYGLKALENWEKLNDPLLFAKIYRGLGTIYLTCRNCTKSKDFFLKSLNFVEQIGDKLLLGQIYANLAGMYQYNAQYEESLTYHKKFSEIMKEIGRIKGLHFAYNQIAYIMLIFGRLQEAKDNYLKGVEIARRFQDCLRERALLLNLSQVLILEGHYTEATKYLNAKYPNILVIKSHEYMRQISLEQIAIYQGDLLNGLIRLQKMITSLEDSIGHNISKVESLTATCFIEAYIFLMRTLLGLKRFDRIQTYALRLSEILNQTEGLMESQTFGYQILGEVAIHTGDLTQAQRYLSRAYQIATKIQYRYCMAIISRSLTQLYLKEGKDFDAEEACEQSLKVLKEIGVRYDYALALKTKAKLRQTMFFTEESLNLYQEAVHLFQNLDTRFDLAQCYEEMAFLYGQLGKSTQANEYHSLSTNLYLSLNLAYLIQPLNISSIH